MKLTPCTSCHRHLKSDERTCPFCGARAAPGGAWVVAAVVGAAISSVSCGTDPAPTPLYGIAPMEDGGTRSSTVTDAGS